MNTQGRIDVHSHLLPGVDDGCTTLEESLACAQRLVEAGYTHAFCTPHIWPSLPNNTVEQIRIRTVRLQQAFDEVRVPLQLLPGGELNLSPETVNTPPDELPTFGMARKFCLFDIWAERLPVFFWKSLEWLVSLGLQPIMAHPERMRAVQDQPELAREFVDAGLLLQGNLQCFGDPPHTHTRRLAEQFLQEGLYFTLGSDCHNLAGLQIRLGGLENAIRLVGMEEILHLTRDNPLRLIA